MDEVKRDIYNRFGENYLQFDPRQDEIKLLSSIAATYIFWSVLSYIITIPKSAKLSNTWILIALIAMLVLEVFMSLTESSVPEFSPRYLTEHELLLLMHCFYPFFLITFRILAEYLFVDVDRSTLDALNEVANHQKVNIFDLDNL